MPVSRSETNSRPCHLSWAMLPSDAPVFWRPSSVTSINFSARKPVSALTWKMLPGPESGPHMPAIHSVLPGALPVRCRPKAAVADRKMSGAFLSLRSASVTPKTWPTSPAETNMRCGSSIQCWPDGGSPGRRISRIEALMPLMSMMLTGWPSPSGSSTVCEKRVTTASPGCNGTSSALPPGAGAPPSSGGGADTSDPVCISSSGSGGAGGGSSSAKAASEPNCTGALPGMAMNMAVMIEAPDNQRESAERVNRMVKNSQCQPARFLVAAQLIKIVT